MYLEYAQHIGADEFIQKWVKTTLKNYIDKIPNTIPTEEVEHILDYLVQSGKKVSQMSYPEAKKLSDAWMKSQVKKGSAIEELPSDTEVILDFKDGFKVVKLVGENAYKREGFLMSHCVASYFGKAVEIYSLRDKDNMPHCTMEKDQQIKGKGNGDIHPKYIGYVVSFLEKVGMTVGDSEMSHLGYVNIENLLPELHKDTKKLLFNKKYYSTQLGPEKLIDKSGNQYLGMDILDYFPMFTEEESVTSFKLKLNFDFSLIAEYHKKVVRKTLGLFKSNTDKKLIEAEDNAKVSAEDNAKVSAEDNAKVSAGYNAKVSAGNYATVSAGNYAKVSAEDNAKVSAEDNAKVSAKKHSILVAETDSILSGEVGTILLLTKRGWVGGEYKIIDWKAEMIDGINIKEDTWYKLDGGKLIEV